MTKSAPKEEPRFTYKTSTVGNGGLYGWNKYDESGKLVESSTQTWNSEADAEKAIRTIASGTDTIEVVNVKNINTDSNVNVNLVKKPEPSATVPNPHGDEKYAGMATVDESIEDKAKDDSK